MIASTIIKTCGMGSLFGLMQRQDIEVGLMLFASTFTSNWALNFGSYPFMVLAKSAKVLPIVMIGWIRGIYKVERSQFIITITITCGLVLFNLNLSKVGEFNESMIGIVLVLASLLFDGMCST